MHALNNHVFLLLISSFVSSILSSAIYQTCDNVHGRNFSELSGVWRAHQLLGNIDHEYWINICNGLSGPSECNGSFICLNQSGRFFPLGNHDPPPVIQSANSSSISFYIDYNTSSVCKIDGGNHFFYRSSITFECGRTLGSPIVISSDNCTVDFLWETSRACLSHPTDARREVRCYDFDSNGKKRDLEYLIKQSGAHYVKDPSSSSTNEDGVYINVCRNIQEGSLRGCPADAAACLIRNGHSYMLGSLTDGVNSTEDDRLVLEYSAPSSASVPPECSSNTPKVVITFVCPGRGRGSSKLPIVTSSLNCQYNVEWWTEAACVIDTITSSSCGLDVQTHGIELDLSPLTKKAPADHYSITTSTSTVFAINICASTGVQCGTNSYSDIARNAVCQISGSSSFIAGDKNYGKVKYYDGQLSLTYEMGDRCTSNGFHRRSVILFHCNETAGAGTPTFNHELHCNYYFDWPTKYACLRAPVCHVTDDAGQTYDLSTLTRIRGAASSNWKVLNTQDTRHDYFINVCGELVHDDLTAHCPLGASICSTSKMDASKLPSESFGSFSHSSLTRQANKLKLVYKSGSSCGEGKVKNTTINFYCKMGDLESSPVLKYKSSDGCEVVLTWHTAAACPLKSVEGTNCMVSDEESGLTFDLQRLAKPTNDAYKITVSKYDYYINVCSDLTNVPCNHTNRHVAACQHEKSGEKRNYVLGQTSSRLLYYNGFVKLLYEHGDQYHDHNNRTMQISFLCDPDKAAGRPEFMHEANHTYVFNWYTSYVCPFTSTQCMATGSDGAQYDLSSLAKSEDDKDANWSVLGEQVAGKGRRKYYLNVCRPVNEVHSSTNRDVGCDALAGACQTMVTSQGEEAIAVASLGRPTSAPQIESGGHLVLTYSNGDNCTENGKTKKFQTRIHFSCRKGALASSPRFLERTACSVVFEWATEAACPIDQDKGVENDKLCEVKSRNSQYIFNLEPLKRNPHLPYNVTGPNGFVYELNVCGDVKDCQSSGDTTSYAGCRKAVSSNTYDERVVNHTAPSYSDDGRLTIEYKESKRNSHLEYPLFQINFICNRREAKGEPVFVGVDGYRTRFDFQTSLACEPQAVDCLVADNFGNQYDLSPLSTPDHPWRVIDAAHSRSFYLSVCRPLSPIQGCQGGAIGACYVEESGGRVNGSNLGLIRANPQAVSNGGQSSAVSIVYMGGDQCKNDNSRRYSTRILFQCSNTEGTAPVLQTTNVDPCEFFFIWHTPVACPIKKAVTAPGQSCTVVDPLYHMTFNLSSLTKREDYSVRAGGEWDFDVHICGALNSGVGGCKNSGSCQVSHSNPLQSYHDAGKPNTSLAYEDGVVTLTYLHGESCHQGQFDRSTVIRFTCHHEDSAKPAYVNESADCTYVFDWPTPKVCPPIKIVECIAQDASGAQYDLSSLSLAHDNHKVATRGETGRIYYLNVCRSLLHKPGVTCPPNSAACFQTADRKFYNLGHVVGGPRIADGKLSLTYVDGDVCLSNNARNYTTTVHFQCDKTAAVDSSPIMTSDRDSCEVELLWMTRAACSLTDQSQSTTRPSCTAVNPKSKHEFNLTSLSSPTFHEVLADDGRVFHINVCSAVTDTNCPTNTSNCVTQGGSHYSAGQVSSQLVYNDGALSLHYRHGSQCTAHTQYRYSTVISFVCHRSSDAVMHEPHGGASKPVFVGDDPATCTHYFSWHTHLACEIQTPCSVVNTTSGHAPHVIDMSPLISERGHYVAMSDVSGKTAAYYINVCRPLEPIKGVNCPPGSAVCEVTKGRSTKSLGFIDPMENFMSYDAQSDTVTLRYGSSQACETSNHVNVSTKIVFSCLPGSSAVSSLPRLTTVTSDCVYVFEWGTQLLCPSQQPKPAPSSPNCTFHDPITEITYDLTKLARNITVKDKLGSFRFDLCSNGFTNIRECADSAACFRSSDNQAFSLGRADTRVISSGAVMKAPVQMTFKSGSKCPNSAKKKQVKVILRCDQQKSSVSSNKLTIYYDPKEQCEYTVVWPTSHVCPLPRESCVVSDSSTGATYDLSLLSSISHSWHFQDGDHNDYFINLCRALPRHNSMTSSCHENATVCKVTKKDKKAHSFGILRSQVMEVVSHQVAVHYRGGDRRVCPDEEMSASSRITFECGASTIGEGPKFKAFSQSDCTLHITWKTRIACANKPTPVHPDEKGRFTDPKSNSLIDLSPLMSKTWIARGDLREGKAGPTLYHYAISLRGQLDASKLDTNAVRTCDGSTAVCQYKPRHSFARKIAEASTLSPVYVMADSSLEMTFTSTDRCGKNSNKTSHVSISLRCSQYVGLGHPTFIYESNECGYSFQWYTSVMCIELTDSSLSVSSTSPSSGSQQHIDSNKNAHEVAGRHSSSAAAIVIGILIALLVFGLLFFVLRNSRGRVAAKGLARKAFCCSGTGEPTYRFIKNGDVNDEEGTSLFDDDDEGMLREETSLLGATSQRRAVNHTETPTTDILPSGGAMGTGSDDDLFDIPQVKVASHGKKKKSNKKRSEPSKSSTLESDDLLGFIKPSNRAPGVGGEKTLGYHDDDDVDMLDA